MPSPFGHALAGLAIGWSADQPASPNADVAASQPRQGSWVLRERLALTCALLAALPDADLLFHAHRAISHSLVGVLIVTIVLAVVTRWVTGRFAWRIVLICGAAYASHLAIDWLSVDNNVPAGIQLLWPVKEWFIAPWSVFPMTERDNPLSPWGLMKNGKAALTELVVLGPFVWAAWATRTRRSRARISGRGVRQPPSGEVVGMAGISDPQAPGA